MGQDALAAPRRAGQAAGGAGNAARAAPAGGADRAGQLQEAGICLGGELDLGLSSNRDGQLLWRSPEASLRVMPESERLSSSKGQTLRKGGTQSHGPSTGWDRQLAGRSMAARLPKGWA